MRALVAAAVVVGCACAGTPAPAPVAPQAAATPAPDEAHIVGRVRDARTGEPLSFATVMATPAGTAEQGPNETTDGAGAFRLTGLQPGRYKVFVYYATMSVRWQDVELAAGQELELDIALETGELDGPAPAARDEVDAGPDVEARTTARRGAIAGRVVDDATGEELEGAVVAVTSPHMRDAQLAVVDEHGVFRIVGLPPGTYHVSVAYRLVDYGSIEVQRGNVEVKPGETTQVALRLDTSVRAVQ